MPTASTSNSPSGIYVKWNLIKCEIVTMYLGLAKGQCITWADPEDCSGTVAPTFQTMMWEQQPGTF